jgi:hypothetical protein
MAADRNVPVRSFVYAQRPPNEQLALGVPHGADLDAREFAVWLDAAGSR